THTVRIDSSRVAPLIAAKIVIVQNTLRNMTSRRRRHTNNKSTMAVAKKATATIASETTLSQINSGFHCRHAPCGVSVDMSGAPIRAALHATAIRSVSLNDRNDSGFSPLAQARRGFAT